MRRRDLLRLEPSHFSKITTADRSAGAKAHTTTAAPVATYAVWRGLLPPFLRADSEGLDTVLERMEGLRERVGERFTPPTILRRLVAQGRLGQKSGQGFYAYPQPDPEQPVAGAVAVRHHKRHGLSGVAAGHRRDDAEMFVPCLGAGLRSADL